MKVNAANTGHAMRHGSLFHSCARFFLAAGLALCLTLPLKACQQQQETDASIKLEPGQDQAMILGAATHFAQGWPEKYADHIDTLEIKNVRDAIYWDLVEERKGSYEFTSWRTTYPDTLAEMGVDVSITTTGTHDRYDDGNTVYKPHHVAALARFLSATLERFPNVTAVEIGNEINSENFLNGPLLEADYPRRIELYLRQLRGLYLQLEPLHPDKDIIGGAAHSVPVDFLSIMFEQDAADYMTALAIHPYKSAPEVLDDELALLRQRLNGNSPKIHVTEFGLSEPEKAADYLLKMIAVMATEGVEVAYWYAMVRQDNSEVVPLIEKDGELTEAGQAFQFAQRYLLTHPIKNVSPDSRTYAFLVGDKMLMLWGEPRSIKYTSRFAAYDSAGDKLEQLPLETHPETVVLLVSSDKVELGENILLGPSPIIADSFHDFQLVPSSAPDAPDAKLERFFLKDGELIETQTFGGGDRKNSHWNPHFGHEHFRPAQITSDHLVPVAFRTDEGFDRIDIVHRYTAETDESVRVRVQWTPREQSDGMTYRILLNEHVIREADFETPVDMTTAPLVLTPGDHIDIVLGTRKFPRNDIAQYRIQILESEE